MAGGLRVLTATASLAMALALAGCGGSSSTAQVGDPAAGREHFDSYSCGACHRVSGVASARGRTGPDLDGLADQRIIAGVLPMTPEFLAAWIADPTEHSPETGMPDLGVDEQHARDIAAWLLSR